ncbi:MAG: hypothetical protein MUP76_09850 [Acidimicrobiia bacterium]|nr:hypothetical protein [Acidimicrobiia bacterium]
MTIESSSPSRAAPAVAAVVIAEDAALTAACLAAVGRQVYAPAQVLVVGGGDEIRTVAGQSEVGWRANLRAVMESLGPEITFVWVLLDRSLPRADALGSLIRDGSRVDASVAGSKILDSENDRILVAVGTATDVFDAPYSGLQDGEIDQSQYDVVRDVAAVSEASMLVRRDLFVGLRGVDHLMAPGAAAIDLCQRARLRGGRVVVAPSSEVLFVSSGRAPDWRERAGEIRAMLKVYSLITLLWAIPLAFLTGIAESIISPFLGRWKLFGFLAAWGWNLLHLPSAIRARLEARRGRQVGDEELFRYQTGGSARLRLLWDETLERLRARFPDGVLSGFTDVLDAGQQVLRKPTFLVGFASVLFAIVATRSVWAGALPITGFSLPPGDSATAALGAYAGGWNPAGLGSPEVLHPSVAATALAQLVLLGKSGLTTGLLTLAAFLSGVLGAARLMRRWGMAQIPGYLAGIVMMGGPAMIGLAGGGQWAPVIALGVMPWILVAALREVNNGWPGKVGQIAAVTVFSGIVGMFAPAALLIAPVAALVWAAVGKGRRRGAVQRVLAGTALAIPLLIPWVLYADLGAFLTAGGPAFWDPTPAWLVLGVVGVAAVGALIAGDKAVSSVAAWGGILVALGWLVARTGDFGTGREVEAAALMAVSLGTAGVVGAATGFGTRRKASKGIGYVFGMTAVFAAAGLVAATGLVAAPGRAGLPSDEYRDALSFATAAGDVPSRILLLGTTDTLPGESRDFEGLGYRVVDAPYPHNWDAYLHEPRLGDEALHEFLETMLDGELRRAGAELAEFGIGWVAFTEESQMQVLFESQLDMVALRSFGIPVYRNEAPTAIAAGADGGAWQRQGTGFVSTDGPGGVSVRIAQNADFRWGPGEWVQDDWANVVQVAVGGDEVAFSGESTRLSMAIGAGAWFLLLVATAVVGRLRRT